MKTSNRLVERARMQVIIFWLVCSLTVPSHRPIWTPAASNVKVDARDRQGERWGGRGNLDSGSSSGKRHLRMLTH